MSSRLKFKKEVKVGLTKEEELYILRWYVLNEPKTVKAFLAKLERNGNLVGDCPFPEDCNKYPCKEMACNADTLSNGYPRKGH